MARSKDPHGDRLDAAEVSHEVGPGDLDLSLVEALLKVDLQAEGKEAADDMADGGVVVVVVDGLPGPRRREGGFQGLPGT